MLRGVVCDRYVRVLVTPSDPMADGLDRDQVETSEAVTLLQLFQGLIWFGQFSVLCILSTHPLNPPSQHTSQPTSQSTLSTQPSTYPLNPPLDTSLNSSSNTTPPHIF